MSAQAVRQEEKGQIPPASAFWARQASADWTMPTHTTHRHLHKTCTQTFVRDSKQYMILFLGNSIRGKTIVIESRSILGAWECQLQRSTRELFVVIPYHD